MSKSDFDNIRTLHKIKRFENELAYLSGEDAKKIDPLIIQERTQNINIILSKLKSESVPLNNDVNKINTNEQLNDLYKDIEKYIYRKPWNKLQPFHRITKIKEYVDKNMEDLTFRNQILEELIKLVQDKKLASNNQVKYDPNKEEIEHIPALHIDYEDKTFKIKSI